MQPVGTFNNTSHDNSLALETSNSMLQLDLAGANESGAEDEPRMAPVTDRNDTIKIKRKSFTSRKFKNIKAKNRQAFSLKRN